MKKPFRKISLLLTAAALAATLAGCSEADQARLDRFCQQNGISDCHLFVPGAVAPSPSIPTATGATLTAIDAASVPTSLMEWAASMQSQEQSDSNILTEAGHTFIAIAGGLQSSGGYMVEVVNITQKDGIWVVEAKVVPPAADEMVTAAMTNPIGFFQAPKLEGAVQVVVSPPPQVEAEAAVDAVAIAAAEAPEQLVSWAESQRQAEESGSLVINDGAHTYVGVAGGLQSTGGYQLEIARIVAQDGGWLIEAHLVPPAPDAIVTMAFTNPVGLFQLPLLEGAVEVVVLVP